MSKVRRMLVGFNVMIVMLFLTNISFAGEIDYPVPCAMKNFDVLETEIL